jgi:hypothetical protein
VMFVAFYLTRPKVEAEAQPAPASD